jgi:4-hydroxy-4-methyl-2-oxoglutarate aldolase
VDEKIKAALAKMPTATIHEAADRKGALPSAIKPVAPEMKLFGQAVTVHSPPNDNLWIHRALYIAEPGDVLVVYVGGGYESGYWGEIMSAAAMARKLGGLVIDGCVRDCEQLRGCGFPVFSRGLCIRGTGKDLKASGWINVPIAIGDVRIAPGDLIVGDQDGVVAISQDAIAQTANAAVAREAREAAIVERLRKGETTLAIYDLPS